MSSGADRAVWSDAHFWTTTFYGIFDSVWGRSLLIVGAAGCSGPWHLSREPKLRVDVASGCPRSDVGYEDVFNTYGGSRVVPADPDGGIVCRYPLQGPLAQEIRLGSAQANLLAGAIRRVGLRVPKGSYSCPNGTQSVVVIGLSYPSGPDVGLWFADSGCPTLDNGKLGSFFPTAVDNLLGRLLTPK